MSELGILVGAEAERRTAGALRRVAEALPYLQASTVAPAMVLSPGTPVDDGDWLHCDDLLGDPEWLEATICSSGHRIGTGSASVAASLFVLGYSYRVLALSVCCLLMGGVVPRPEAIAMALSKGRPAFVSYRTPTALVLTGDDAPASTVFKDERMASQALNFIISSAVEAHLRLLVEATSCRVRVGRRLLWGNVAASAAVAFRTAEGLLGDWVKPLGEQFFEAAPPELQGQGNFVSLEHQGRRGWYWERRNCCLNDRLSQHIRCSDCSLTPVEERRANYLAGLARS